MERSLFGFALQKIKYLVRLRKVISVNSVKNKSFLTRSQTGYQLQPPEWKSDVLALYTTLKVDARALIRALKPRAVDLAAVFEASGVRTSGWYCAGPVHLTLWPSVVLVRGPKRTDENPLNNVFVLLDSAVVRCRSVSSDVSTGTHVKWIIMVLQRAIKSPKTLMSGESQIYSELTAWHLFHDTAHPLR